jgi:hypothetical protein
MIRPQRLYEDLLKAGGGKVANINIANLNTGVDIQRALEATEAHFGGFDAARRGAQSHAETAALANEAGMTADDLLRRRHGQALNAEQALRARQILAKSAEEMSVMARNMADWTPEEVAAIRRTPPAPRGDLRASHRSDGGSRARARILQDRRELESLSPDDSTVSPRERARQGERG